MTDSMNRRSFLQLTAAAAAMLGLSGYAGVTIAADPEIRKPKPIEAGKKIRLAQVGFGGKGFSDIHAGAFKEGAEVVALCDIDWTLKNVQKTFRDYPNAKRYKDFRKMLLEMDDQIDAVVVSTPDHMHFTVAYMAITMGKHVYVQKPLTQTVWEAEQLLEAARKHGVCTQMGNQGHAGEGCRLVKEWIEAGAIGDVKKVEIWTNRPIWPQGMTKDPDPTPEHKGMAWDQWLGRTAKRPYSDAYHPFKWRGFADFGCGALGDMGCHIMDASFYALNLGMPTSIQAEVSGPVSVGYPEGTTVTFEFPARGKMPAVTVIWRDGKIGGKPNTPEKPKDLEESRKLAIGGQLIHGEKATIYDGNDYCNSPRIIPEAKMKEMQPSLPKKTIRRPTKVGDPYQEFLEAIHKGDPSWAGSNFEYSVGLTKMVVLGNLALRAPGKKLLWDAEKKEVSNVPEVNQYLKPNFREGWTLAELTDKSKWAPTIEETVDLTTPLPEEPARGKGKGGKGKGQGKGKGKGQGKKKAQGAPQA